MSWSVYVQGDSVGAGLGGWARMCSWRANAQKTLFLNWIYNEVEKRECVYEKKLYSEIKLYPLWQFFFWLGRKVVKGVPNALEALGVFIKCLLIDWTSLFKENLETYVPLGNNS